MKQVNAILFGTLIGLAIWASSSNEPRKPTPNDEHNLNVRLCYMSKAAGRDALDRAENITPQPCPEFRHD